MQDYKAVELGARGDEGVDGAVMVEGHLYCHSMPEWLVNASVDFAAGRIDHQQYDARIAEREPYLFRRKNALGDERTRWMCPASGTCPTAMCGFKGKSFERAGRGAPEVRVDAQIVSIGAKPKACAQDSVTVRDDAFEKHRQELRFKSPEWRAVYGMLRNTIEGVNGTAKDGSSVMLEVKSRRRVRGLPAQWLLVLMLVFGENVRRVRRWQQERDEANGDPRKKARSGRRRRKDRARWQAERHRRMLAGLPVAPPPRNQRQQEIARAREREAAALREQFASR